MTGNLTSGSYPPNIIITKWNINLTRDANKWIVELIGYSRTPVKQNWYSNIENSLSPLLKTSKNVKNEKKIRALYMSKQICH